MSGAAAARAPLVVRADGGGRLGSGHVMRCLAVAQEAQDRGAAVVCAMAPGGAATASLEARLAAEGMTVAPVGAAPGSERDADETAAIARAAGARAVMVDGYHFGADYLRALGRAGLVVLLVDDYGHAGEYPCELVLNHNPYASEALYGRRAPSTRLLLGARFALVRREFRRLAGELAARPVPALARRLLVTLGGSDPDDTTSTVLAALQHTRGIDATVIVGGGNPRHAALARAAAALPSVRLLSDTPDMPALMAAADLAVAGAGGTTWELCLLGVPSLLVVLADNQRPVARSAAEAGAAVDLGWHADLAPSALAASIAALAADAPRRAALAAAGRRLIDGRGAARVLDALDEELAAARGR